MEVSDIAYGAVGLDEVAQGKVTVKDLDEGTQETVAQEAVANVLAPAGSPTTEDG